MIEGVDCDRPQRFSSTRVPAFHPYRYTRVGEVDTNNFTHLNTKNSVIMWL